MHRKVGFYRVATARRAGDARLRRTGGRTVLHRLDRCPGLCASTRVGNGTHCHPPSGGRCCGEAPWAISFRTVRFPCRAAAGRELLSGPLVSVRASGAWTRDRPDAFVEAGRGGSGGLWFSYGLAREFLPIRGKAPAGLVRRWSGSACPRPWAGLSALPLCQDIEAWCGAFNRQERCPLLAGSAHQRTSVASRAAKRLRLE